MPEKKPAEHPDFLKGNFISKTMSSKGDLDNALKEAKLLRDESEQCAICLQPLDPSQPRWNAFSTSSCNCGHRFHLKCIHNWVYGEQLKHGEINSTCPLCRQRCWPELSKRLRLLSEGGPNTDAPLFVYAWYDKDGETKNHTNAVAYIDRDADGYNVNINGFVKKFENHIQSNKKDIKQLSDTLKSLKASMFTILSKKYPLNHIILHMPPPGWPLKEFEADVPAPD